MNRRKTMSEAELKLEAKSQPGCGELESLLATLKQIYASGLEASLEVQKLLFGGGDVLVPGLIDFRTVPALRTGNVTVALSVTDRFRELVAALAAAHLKHLIVN
jgi:hypothetical protein